MKNRREASPPSVQLGERPRNWASRVGAIAAALFAASAISAFLYLWPEAKSTELPLLPDLNAAAPAVVELIRDSYADVIRRPRDADAWGRLGMIYFSHQYEFEALHCFQHAEEFDSREPRWPYLRGLVVNSSDDVAAEDAFRKAIELRPTAAQAHVRLGEILLARHAVQDAERQFRSALDVRASDVRAHLGMARCCLMNGDVEGAVRAVKEAERTSAETREVQELLAQVMRRAGRLEEASAAVEAANKFRDRDVGWVDPWATEVLEYRRDARWALRRAAELSEAGQEAAAVELLRQALQADDRDPELHAALAQYYVRSQRILEAQQLLQQARLRHPQSADVLFQSGVAAFLSQDHVAAERYFREALRLRPGAPLAHYNLGHVCLRQGRIDEALEEFLEATRRRPDYSDAHINAAKIYLERRQAADARRSLERALQATPNDATALRLLEQARRME